MIDQDKSKQELIEELGEMRRRVAALEKAARRTNRQPPFFRSLRLAFTNLTPRAELRS